MNNSPWLDLVKYSWPVLCAYSAIAIVALVMMSRHRKPAIFSLIGAGLLLTALAIPTAYHDHRFNPNWSYSFEKARMIYLTADLIRAGGVVMLVVAVYSGRQQFAG